MSPAPAAADTGRGSASGRTRSDDPAIEAWQRLRAISHDPMVVAAGHELMRETGLPLAAIKALRQLLVDGGLPMRQLAERLGCDNSYVTSLVDTLEDRGLARRESPPGDRRVKVVRLTDEGRVIADRVARVDATPPASFSALSDAEVVRLRALLRKVDAARA